MKDPESSQVIKIDDVYEEAGQKLGSVVAENTGSKPNQVRSPQDQEVGVEFEDGGNRGVEQPVYDLDDKPTVDTTAPTTNTQTPTAFNKVVAPISGAVHFLNQERVDLERTMTDSEGHERGYYNQQGNEFLDRMKKRLAGKVKKEVK